MKRRARALFAISGSVLFALASAVSAQQTAAPPGQPVEDPTVVAAARALAVEGVKLARDNRCDEAVDKLERAEQLRHSSIVLAQLGECYIAQGRYVEGAEAMRSVLREGLPDNPSEAMKAAQASARTGLEVAKAKIAMLTIAVDADGEAKPEVSVDGQPIPAALIGAPRPTDPGERTIEATAAGYLPAKRRVTLAPGEADTVTLALVIDPAVARATPAAESSGTGAPEPAPLAASSQPAAAATAAPNYLPAYIAWGTGAVAIAIGVTFGWVAMDQKSDLDRACPGKRCPPEQSARLDAAKANGVIASVAFGVGLGAAVLGGALFLLTDDAEAESPPATARASVTPTGLRVTF